MKNAELIQRLYGSVIAFAKATRFIRDDIELKSHKILFESIFLCNCEYADGSLYQKQIESLDNERLFLCPKCKDCEKNCEEHISYIKYKMTYKEDILKNYLFSIVCSLSSYLNELLKKSELKDYSKHIDFIYDSLFTINEKDVMEDVEMLIGKGLRLLSSTVNSVYI